MEPAEQALERDGRQQSLATQEKDSVAELEQVIDFAANIDIDICVKNANLVTSSDIANGSVATMYKMQGDLDVAKGLTKRMIRTAEQPLSEYCDTCMEHVSKEGDRHEALVASATGRDITTKMCDIKGKLAASPDVIPCFT